MDGVQKITFETIDFPHTMHFEYWTDLLRGSVENCHILGRNNEIALKFAIDMNCAKVSVHFRAIAAGQLLLFKIK